MKKLIAFLLVVVLLVAAMVPVTTAQDDELSVLVIGTTDDIAKLDPADAYSFHDWDLLRATGDALLGFVPGQTELEPRLAVDFPEVSEDGMTYTFTLRDDIAYPDGTVLTAENYAASVTRTLSLEGDPIALVSSIASVEAGEGNTVTFTLNEPNPLFLFQSALTPLIPANPNVFAEGEITNFPEADGIGVVPGVGPYQVVDYVVGEQTVLEVNPNYYGDTPNFDRIIFVYYEESAQLDLAIENGEVDIAWRSVTRTEVERLSGIEGLETLTLPGRIQYMVINHELVTDENIKKGIATAINRDDIVDRALNGLASPLYSMVPPGFAGANEAFLDAYGFGDAAAAREFFEAAGGTEDAPLELEFWYPPNRYGGEVGPAMELIKAQVEETGVVTVTLQTAEWSTYVPAATGGEYPIFFLGWFFDFPDSDNYIQPFAQCEISNGLGVNFCDPAIDELITAQRNLVDSPAEREAVLVELQNAYAEAVVTIPLWAGEDHLIYNTNVVDNVVIGAPLILDYAALLPVGE